MARWRVWSVVAACCLAIVCALPAPTTTVVVEASSIGADKGHAYAVDLRSLGIQAVSDESGRSGLSLSEDGKEFTPHRPHEEIREQGTGRFSHWGDRLYFAASDNSDPRTNGRRYLVAAPASLVAALGIDSRGGLLVIALSLIAVAVSLAPPQGVSGRQWLTGRLVPLGVAFVTVVIIAWAFHRNALDVRLTACRLMYALTGMALLAGLTIFGFVCWRGARKRTAFLGGAADRLCWRATNATVHLAFVLLIVESAGRAFPVHDSFAINPGCRYFWPDWFSPRNSMGYHDAEPALKDRWRVLALGDSFVEGAGVSISERFSTRLQSLLAEDAFGGVTVVNAGKCGADTLDEAIELEKNGDVLQPDLVVVGYCLNDAEGPQPASEQPLGWFDRFLLERAPSYAYYRYFRMWSALGGGPGYASQHELASPGWKRVEEGLDRIATWCDARGVRRVLVVFPIFEPRACDHRPIIEQVVAAGKACGYHAFHLLDDFDGRWEDFAVSPFDAHPGPQAHERIAHRLAERFADLRSDATVR